MSLKNGKRDLKNLKIDMTLFMNDYKNLGGCGCNKQQYKFMMKAGGEKKINLLDFFNIYRNGLRRGYNEYKARGGAEVPVDTNLNAPGSFNIFRDVLSTNPFRNSTNEYLLSDYKYNNFSYLPSQQVVRSIF